MQKKTKNILLLLFLIFLLIAINYKFIDNFLEENLLDYEFVEVERVIDGDTIVVNESSIRLLGINSPERGEGSYEEAKVFLESLVLNQVVRIERFGLDKYYRELAYIFVDGRNINVELVENGFANVYILDNKIYEKELRDAWEKCVKENINLCEKSVDVCVDCILLKEFCHAPLGVPQTAECRGKTDFVIFENVCDYDCDLNNWWIKDEGRKTFLFENFVLKSGEEIKITAEDFNKDYVWTDTGDTLFLRDSEGKLVLWESY